MCVRAEHIQLYRVSGEVCLLSETGGGGVPLECGCGLPVQYHTGSGWCIIHVVVCACVCVCIACLPQPRATQVSQRPSTIAPNSHQQVEAQHRVPSNGCISPRHAHARRVRAGCTSIAAARLGSCGGAATAAASVGAEVVPTGAARAAVEAAAGAAATTSRPTGAPAAGCGSAVATTSSSAMLANAGGRHSFVRSSAIDEKRIEEEEELGLARTRRIWASCENG